MVKVHFCILSMVLVAFQSHSQDFVQSMVEPICWTPIVMKFYLMLMERWLELAAVENQPRPLLWSVIQAIVHKINSGQQESVSVLFALWTIQFQTPMMCLQFRLSCQLNSSKEVQISTFQWFLQIIVFVQKGIMLLWFQLLLNQISQKKKSNQHWNF